MTQPQRLRAAFMFALYVCDTVEVEPQEVHVGQTHGYYELSIQVATAEQVATVADALGIPDRPDTFRGGRSVLRFQEPWTEDAAILPLERPGTLYRADRVQVIAYNVGEDNR